MNVLIVYWHPEPASFNAAMLRTAKRVLSKQGHNVQISDLVEMSFNPVSGRENFTTKADSSYFCQRNEEEYANKHNTFCPDIAKEREKLLWCDLLIFQFPLWWCSMPACMKGWVDRVLSYSRYYDDDHVCTQGYLKDKKAMLSITTGAPSSRYECASEHEDMTSLLSHIQKGVLSHTGFQVLNPFIAYQPSELSEQQRINILEDYESYLLKIKH